MTGVTVMSLDLGVNGLTVLCLDLTMHWGHCVELPH